MARLIIYDVMLCFSLIGVGKVKTASSRPDPLFRPPTNPPTPQLTLLTRTAQAGMFLQVFHKIAGSDGRSLDRPSVLALLCVHTTCSVFVCVGLLGIGKRKSLDGGG